MNSRSALVIDDSKSARFALRRYLEGHGYTVDTADSAESAYAYLKENLPGAIFLDHVMPGVDGFDVLRTIKSDARTGSIPVVICSSNEGSQFTDEARAKGATDVLPKPPSAQQLARVIDTLNSTSPSVIAIMPAAVAVPAPRAEADDAPLGKFAALIADFRSQLLKITREMSEQIAELRQQTERIDKQQSELKHMATAFGRRRADAATIERKLTTPSPRVGGRRKLPRI